MPATTSLHGPRFEWFVAWRHLRDPERRSGRTLRIGLVILAVAIVALVAAWLLGGGFGKRDSFLPSRHMLLVEYLKQGGIIALIVGGVTSYLGILFAAFTVFTAISVFGVFLGTAAPIIALSVMSGFEADLKGKIRATKADVVITRGDDQPFTDWVAVRRKIAAMPDVVASTPFLEGEVMLQGGGSTAGIILRGIDPATATSVLELDKPAMREGQVDDLAHPERVVAMRAQRFGDLGDEQQDAPPADEAIARPTIILGEELYARTLRVFIGSEVDVACPLCGSGPAGPEPRLRPFRVAGHFYSGMYEFDSKLAYISLPEAQKFFRAPGEVTGIDVRTRVPDDAPQLGTRIQAALGAGYEVRSWQELNRGLFMALRLEKIAMFVVLTFIALVASFSIISNLIMLVTEKGREIAILKSMGAGDGAILRIFFAEGLYIGLLGLVVGVASGILGCVLIKRYGLPLPTDVYYISDLPVVMRAGEIGTVAALALALCCLATLYPAVLASRLRPVAGLRYE